MSPNPPGVQSSQDLDGCEKQASPIVQQGALQFWAHYCHPRNLELQSAAVRHADGALQAISEIRDSTSFTHYLLQGMVEAAGMIELVKTFEICSCSADGQLSIEG